MTALLSQFGTVGETTFGTPVTVTKFWETNQAVKIKPDRDFAQSMALRSGTRAVRSDKFVPYAKGGTCQVDMPVPTKSWGFWLVHMLGTVASGAAVDSNYTHTGTVGSLLGDFFTAQTGNVLNPAGTVQAFTGEGGKVTEWELACDIDGLLNFTATCDFEDVSTAIGLATASYPAAATVFAFTGAAVTVAGASVELRNFKVGMNNNLDVNRRFLRGSALKKEPVENGYREVKWSGDMEFTSTAQYDRFVSTTAAGALASIVATFTGPIIHAGATYPALIVTIPAARFDDVDISASGAEAFMQSVSGIGMSDGTAPSPIQIEYRTTDVTP